MRDWRGVGFYDCLLARTDSVLSQEPWFYACAIRDEVAMYAQKEKWALKANNSSVKVGVPPNSNLVASSHGRCTLTSLGRRL